MIYLSFKGDESGNVIVLNYVTATVVSQATVAVIPIGPAAVVDTKSGGSLFMASSVSHLLQGYRFVQPNVLPSFTADLSNATEERRRCSPLRTIPLHKSRPCTR